MTMPKPVLGVDIEQVRYSRHVALAGFGREGQDRLRAARVLVVGAGGLGSPVLAYLAAAGVGVLGIVDDDVVDTSNLQRQVIHRDDAVGMAKTSSAADFVRGLNPDVEIVEHPLRLDVESALDLLPGYDVVVDGTDNFAARYLLNDVCVALGLPLVWASISEYEGQLGVVSPGRGPCYRCVFPQAPYPGTVLNCAEAGVLGVLPGVVGSLQATEVIKVLTGLGHVLSNGVLIYDALNASMSTLAVQRDERCAACGAGVTEPLPCFGLNALGRDFRVRQVAADEVSRADLVVDVREDDEVQRRPWPGALLRPWSLWDSETTRELVTVAASGQGSVVVVCASGTRSSAAVQALVAAGAQPQRVASLQGGVAAADSQAGQQGSL